MKIGYFADGPWSHLALEKIVAQPGFEIAFIVPRFDSRDAILAQWASKLGVDYFPIQNVNNPESIEWLRQHGADVFVSMSFNQILRRPILDAAPMGFINCHAGALPFYRGRNILNWALINGAGEFGVTVHYVDEGIDTGDIIMQRKESISADDTYASLLAKAVFLCADTLHDSLVAMREGRVNRISQASIHPVGFYCGRRVEGDEWIDWNWSSERIFNFVRAISTPGPGALTWLAGQELIIQKAALIERAPVYIGTPGEVVGVRGDGIVVKTGDATLLVADIVGGPSRFRIGMRLGVNLAAIVRDLMKRVSELEACGTQGKESA